MKLFRCPQCDNPVPEKSIYCNMCGIKLEEALAKKEQRMIAGEIPLCVKTINTIFGEKIIKVVCKDIKKYKEPIDILTISAAHLSYDPVPGTMISAIKSEFNIDVSILSERPLLDCREIGNCWISDEVDNCSIKRIGCVERGSRAERFRKKITDEESIINSLKSYFHMLDVVSDGEVPMETLVMPILGAGSMRMDNKLVVYPMVNEALSFLKRNPSVKQLIFLERDYEKAVLLRDCLEESHQLSSTDGDTIKNGNREKPFIFISYCTQGDSEVAQQMSDYMSSKGIEHWFAPNELKSGPYAEGIAEAIGRCTHFICIVSKNSMKSEHVLNEIDLAFQYLPDGMKILPFRLDDGDLQPSFKYYLSRMQWTYGNPPPIENRIRDFIDGLLP